jgi:hypothetical protein
MRTASALALLGLILAVAMPESTKARCFPSSRGARYDCPKESDVKDDGDKKLDPDTGLLVISRESDQNWNSNPNPPVPLSQIIKLTSDSHKMDTRLYPGSYLYQDRVRSSSLPLWRNCWRR